MVMKMSRKIYTYTHFFIPAIYRMSQKVRAPDFDRIFIKKLCSSQSSGVFLCGWILLAYVASFGFNPIFSRRGIHWDTSCGTVL